MVRRFLSLPAFALWGLLSTATMPQTAGADPGAKPKVEVGGFTLQGDGPRAEALKTNALATLPGGYAACLEAEISANPKYPGSFKCYAELGLGKDGKLESVKFGGMCVTATNCLEMRTIGVDAKAKGPSVEKYTAFFVVLNSIPAKQQPMPVAPPPVAQPAKEEPGILEQLGHGYMENQRAEERKREAEAAANRKAAADAEKARRSKGQLALEIPYIKSEIMKASRLGRPLTKDMQFLDGEEGKTLFPGAEVDSDEVRDYALKVGEYTDESKTVVSAWLPFLSAESVKTTTQRVFHRVAQLITKIEQIDDTAKMRTPPPGAEYYVSAILYGYSYSVFATSTSKSDNASGAMLTSFIRAKETSELQQSGFSTQVFAKGLVMQSGKAMMARSAADVQQNFIPEKDLKPQPVMVVVRKIR